MQWVQAEVHACASCQKIKDNVNVALKTARHVLIVDNHRSQASVDLVGLDADIHGNDTCAVISNHNTKFIFLHPSHGKLELNTINALLIMYRTMD